MTKLPPPKDPGPAGEIQRGRVRLTYTDAAILINLIRSRGRHPDEIRIGDELTKQMPYWMPYNMDDVIEIVANGKVIRRIINGIDETPEGRDRPS